MYCTYHCQADSFNLKGISTALKEKNFIYRFFDDVLYVEMEDGEDVFIFSYGCIVFWNVSERKKDEVFEICNGVNPPLQKTTSDKCKFMYGTRTHIYEEDDLIELESYDLLIRLSLSHGLSQSAKLDVFEHSVLHNIEKTRPLVQQIQETGKSFLSRKKLSKLIGKLFQERNFINLDCDLLDTPEFFWRRPGYEPYYHQAAEYMDIHARLGILNRRLDIIHELYDFLSNELNHSHSSFLEWIIIILIVTEVILTVAKDILKLF